MTLDASTRILVTGGSGFLGSHVVERLQARGYTQITAPRRAEYDLRDQSAIIRLFKQANPQVVIHMAAVVGGIGANQAQPGAFFYDNLMMGIQLIHEGYKRGIEKFVALGTICAYPKFTPVPFREEDLWNGYPEETNAPYGIAKKALLTMCQAYRQQYGLNAIYLLPVNLYGPGDNFDPQSSHVIPALIRKFVEAQSAGTDHIVAWGTGGASREFLYVEDAAQAIALATLRYDAPDPVNIGAGREITIRDLTALIARLCDFAGRIEWDSSQPDGQPRRCLDTLRARERFGFVAGTSLEEGLKKTIHWYRLQV